MFLLLLKKKIFYCGAARNSFTCSWCPSVSQNQRVKKKNIDLFNFSFSPVSPHSPSSPWPLVLSRPKNINKFFFFWSSSLIIIFIFWLIVCWWRVLKPILCEKMKWRMTGRHKRFLSLSHWVYVCVCVWVPLSLASFLRSSSQLTKIKIK